MTFNIQNDNSYPGRIALVFLRLTSALALCCLVSCSIQSTALPSALPTVPSPPLPTALRVPATPTSDYKATPSPLTLVVSTQTSEPPVPSASITTQIALASDLSIGRITSVRTLQMVWASSGQSVLYEENTGSGDNNNTYEWFSYALESGERTPIEAPLYMDRNIWVRLDAASPTPDDSFWFDGAFSPTRKYFIYLRRPMLDFWIAKTDGSELSRLGQANGCFSLSKAIWFHKESKVIVACAGESGPPGLFIADVAHRTVTPLSQTTAYDGLDYNNFALSPDESTLAIPSGYIQLIPLGGGPLEFIARGGIEPNWSLDGQRLYYQMNTQSDSDNCQIRVYDFRTKVDSLVFDAPLLMSNGMQVPILCGYLAMSPKENAALFLWQGLWVAKWSSK